ncbi:MAG: DUF6145 family protein, partial [Clostridiales bacterium]|nr:DUF6145 family protein [Clostridiales bacterium]
CTASVYTRKYYVNPEYKALPAAVLADIHKMCTVYAEKLHCEFSLKFDGNGDVFFETNAPETDYNFDEIGAKLDTDRLARENRELFNGLKLWYTAKIKGQLK